MSNYNFFIVWTEYLTLDLTTGMCCYREYIFNVASSQYMMVNHLQQITINGIGNVVNRGNIHDPFSQAEITCLLQVHVLLIFMNIISI